MTPPDPLPADRSVFPGFDAMTDDLDGLVRQLAGYRRDAGLSQAEIAARMRTSQSAIARLEAGGSDIRMSTLQRYAAAVGAAVHFAVVRAAGGAAL